MESRSHLALDSKNSIHSHIYKEAVQIITPDLLAKALDVMDVGYAKLKDMFSANTLNQHWLYFSMAHPSHVLGGQMKNEPC